MCRGPINPAARKVCQKGEDCCPSGSTHCCRPTYLLYLSLAHSMVARAHTRACDLLSQVSDPSSALWTRNRCSRHVSRSNAGGERSARVVLILATSVSCRSSTKRDDPSILIRYFIGPTVPAYQNYSSQKIQTNFVFHIQCEMPTPDICSGVTCPDMGEPDCGRRFKFA